jgi:predicted transcriptional regulator
MIDNNIVTIGQQSFAGVRVIQIISLIGPFLTKSRQQGKRSSLDINASILDFLIVTDATLSGITSSVKLNRNRAKEYVKGLINQGFVRQKQLRFVTYSVTEEGISWLKLYRSLVGGMSSESDTSRPDFENSIVRRKIWIS